MTVLAEIRKRRGLLAAVAAGVLFPFLASFVLDGAGPGAVIGNADGNARFLQGLAIEIFILALYALSYDLVLGITGLLSFGHAMFFAVGAYIFGIMVKSFDLGLVAALAVVAVAAVMQAMLFAVVLPRVRGITFALITLGFSSVFWIVIRSSDLQPYTGAEIGLQGVRPPVWFLDTTNHRFVFYLVVLAILVGAYLLFQRIADSPTGKVLVAVRDNESRATMLGYNTFWFKAVALTVSSFVAALAGILHALHQPIVTPAVAGLGFTVTALLIILIGGVGTITGALVGAAVFRLLQFFLDRWFGGSSGLMIGLAYVLLVLYLPYGIVGTWRARTLDAGAGRNRLLRLLTGRPHPRTPSAEER